MSDDLSRIERRERELRESAPTDLPALALAEDATQVLIDAIGKVSIDPSTDREPSGDELRLQALWFMAIIGARALRAAMAVIAVGYEDQAVGFQRLLDELHNRAQRVRKDESGEYAKEWLAGRSLDKGAKLAGQDFWEFMSGPVHANVRAVLDWLAISKEDGSAAVVVGPERRPEVANPTLTYMSGGARDLTSMLALQAEIDLDLSDLDAKVRAAFSEHIPDDD